MQSSMNMNEENSSESTITHLSDHFFMNLKLNNDEKDNEIDVEEVGEDEEEDEDDFSFSMAFDGVIDDESQITAEEAFSNGLIKPVYPFFNRDLLLKEEELFDNHNGDLGQVKKVFVPAAATTAARAVESTSGSVVAGPYCDWDKKSGEICKKSNSTGFSKIWRFKDFMHRSSSDGKDAFVFLNHHNSSSPAAAATAATAATAVGVSRKKKDVGGGESKVMTVKGRKVVKSSKKAAAVAVAVSPHEVYLRSKAKEEQRRRSHHNYRPEVVGLFTNITGGGLTRNVHPF